MSFDAVVKAVTRRIKPVRAADGTTRTLRVGSYGDVFVESVLDPIQSLANEGSYFTSTTPTIGTAITPNAVETSFSDTRGFIVIGNTSSPVDPLAKSIHLDFIQLLMSGTAPTATTVLHFAGKRSAFSREPTTAANRTILAPANAASDGPSPVARVMCYANAGAMTVPASVAADPIVLRTSIPTSLGITGDNYTLKFDTKSFAPILGLTAVRATAPASLVVNCPPVVLRPGEWFVLHRWWVAEATNAPAFEIMIGHYER